MSQCCQCPQTLLRQLWPLLCTVAGPSPSTPLGPEGTRGTPAPGSLTFPPGREPCAALPSHTCTAGLPTSSKGLLILPSQVTPQHGLVFPFFLCSPNPLQRTNKLQKTLQNLFCLGKISWLLWRLVISLMVLSHVQNKELANYWGLMCVNKVSLALGHALWFMHCLWLTVELQEESWALLHGLPGPLTWNTTYCLRKVCWSLF